MKATATICILFITGSLFGQPELTGSLGLTFGMNQQSAKSIMASKKIDLAESTIKYLAYRNVPIGTMTANTVVVQFVNNKMHTIKVLFLPDLEAKSQELYNDLAEILTLKYGKAESYRHFKTPYEDGDGYEMQAVKLGKADIASYWECANRRSVSLEIIPFADKVGVTILYQDDVIYEELKAQQDKINVSDF